MSAICRHCGQPEDTWHRPCPAVATGSHEPAEAAPVVDLDLRCLGCGNVNLDTDACPNSGTHPGVKVGQWKVHAYCLDCCGCPEHTDAEPPMGTEEALGLAIWAMNTLLHPEASSDEDMARFDADAERALAAVVDMREWVHANDEYDAKRLHLGDWADEEES